MYNFDKESAALIRKLHKMAKEGKHYALLAGAIRKWKVKADNYGIDASRVDPVYADALVIQFKVQDGEY